MKTLRPLLLSAALLLAHNAHAQDWFGIGKQLISGLNATSMSEEDEIAIGNEVASRVMGVYPAVPNDALQHKLNKVGLWVAMQSSRPTLPWRFALLQSDTVNAIAAPGGIVLVTTGMFALINDEAELACVLGHEIGHITRKHQLTALRNGLLKGAALDTASAVAGNKGSALANYAKEKGREIAAEMVSLKLGRSEESEADADGVLLAARAGYAPGACLDFMRRLEAKTEQTNLFEDLGQTHPPASDRVKDVEKALQSLPANMAAEGQRPSLGSGKKK